MHHGLNNDFIYAVSKVIAYFSNGKEDIPLIGTGFFIRKNDDFFLITNRHVVDIAWTDTQNANYALIKLTVDRRAYNPATQSVEIEVFDVVNFKNIVFPDTPEDDIACLKGIQVSNGWSGVPPVTIDHSWLATSEQYHNDLSVCDHLAVIGFPDVYDHKHDVPILRSGVISSDPRLDYSFDKNYHGHVLAYEAYSTPGASGSPVFATQKGFTTTGDFLAATPGFYRQLLLIGINAGCMYSAADKVHQQMSYLYKSDQIISLIDKSDRQYP